MSEIRLPEVSTTSAEEFLNCISPVGKYFEGYGINSPWIFRGQGKNGDWSLVPSLFRSDDFSMNKLQAFTYRDVEDLSELLLVERDLIIRFFEIADKRGLTIPDDSQELRIFLETINSLDDHVRNGDWKGRVKDKALSLMALAQHYGVPTRLLDWTRSPYVAAFFAAESALSLLRDEIIRPTDRFVVWSFYFPSLGRQDEDSRKYDPVIIVTAPKATNTNLQAQQGLFSLINSIYFRNYAGVKDSELLSDFIHVKEIEYLNDARIKYGGYPSLDTFLENIANTVREIPHREMKKRLTSLVASAKFQKYTLQASEAEKLLYLLAKHDITYTTVYPGYHSIVSDIRVQNSWK